VRLVLGVDGGGSKTHALVADEHGEVVGFASSGRSNWEDTGLEAAGAALAEAIGGALVDPLGLAGPRKLENDSFIALRAGASRPFGVVVVAGTGHVAAGRSPAGRTARTLGLGPMYGDFGSATDVAAEAVRRWRTPTPAAGRRPPSAGGLFRSRNRLLEGTLVDTLARQAPLAAPVHLTCKPVVGAALEAWSWPGSPPTRACTRA
jgi:N-acetylglucosamine kinase-like BadF-type ATPase